MNDQADNRITVKAKKKAKRKKGGKAIDIIDQCVADACKNAKLFGGNYKSDRHRCECINISAADESCSQHTKNKRHESPANGTSPIDVARH